jgi:hypothetical protein
MQESIYRWVQPEVVPPPKPPRYVSKHDSRLPPTGSTYSIAGSTVDAGSNLGDMRGAPNPIRKKASATLGRSFEKPNPNRFLKKKSGTAGTKQVDRSRVTKTADDIAAASKKKPRVPQSTERPIMGLQTTKNFIVANAVENILAVPKRVGNNGVRYTQKKDYGKVPAYLESVKREVQEEKQMMEEYFQQFQEDEEEATEVMSEAEKQELINRLKAKWDSVNAEYQKITMHVKLDTLTKVRRKEGYEQQLQELENAINRLQRSGPVVIRQEAYY